MRKITPEIIFVKEDPWGIETEALYLPVFENKFIEDVEKLDHLLDGELNRLRKLGDLKGRIGEIIRIYPRIPEIKVKRVITIGLGPYEKFSEETLRVYGGYIGSDAKNNGYESISIVIPYSDKIPGDRSLYLVLEGFNLSTYTFSLKTRDEIRGVKKVILKEPAFDAKPVLERVEVLSEAIYIARDIANTPASDMNPEKLENYVRDLFKEFPDVEISVIRGRELVERGMNGIYSVGKGSSVEPRLIILRYKGAENESPVAFVGKTVTFDAGGLDLKTPQGMRDMKFDKSGGAAVIGVMYAVAKSRLPVNLVVLIPAVENLPSGSSYKPGDVLRMYGGLTVEIDNTDAEGRVIMADAISYAKKDLGAKIIIDIATLTGAIVVALGNHAAGLFTNSERLAEMLTKASERSGDRLWRMPLWEEYFEDIKSEVADIKNTGVAGAAGAQAGAAFLAKFAEDVEWAHLDIAGVAWVQQEGPKKPYYPKGATGYGVRLLYEFLEILRSSK
jgi:leucyl aminopeptidase